MILAAGLGTRLRPLTDRVPKALVEVAGVPMLERVARRLVEAGVDRLVVNVHHHAERIRGFIEERDGFGIDVRISHEPDRPLETGGGLARAAGLFRRDAPFFLHNVDVITDADLAALYRAHLGTGALATLAVSDRDSRRRLRFDDYGLQARVNRRATAGGASGGVGAAGAETVDMEAAGTEATGAVAEARPARARATDRAFAGIHAVSPEIFDLMTERGAFPIFDAYFRLVAAGHRILPYDIGPALWLEVGDPARLEAARRALEPRSGSFPLNPPYDS